MRRGLRITLLALALPTIASAFARLTNPKGARADGADADKAEASERCAIRIAIALAGKSADPALVANPDPKSAIDGRLASPGFADRYARFETPHFVHIFFNGGLSALFAGCADKCIGVKHGNALHTTPQNLNSGGEHAFIRDGGNGYLTQLAYYMGGDSAFKAVYFGDRAPAYQAQPAFQGVPIQRIVSLSDAVKAAGSDAPDPNAPNRALAAASLETAEESSSPACSTHPIATSSCASPASSFGSRAAVMATVRSPVSRSARTRTPR